MLSKSGKYALRAVICLATKSNEGNKLSPKEIATNIDVPIPYLATVLKQLSKNGLIESSKGRNGGFYLTEENLNKPLIDVIECIDGLDRFKDCLMGLPNCNNENPCPIHELFAPLRNTLIDDLSTKSIKEFATSVKEGETQLF